MSEGKTTVATGAGGRALRAAWGIVMIWPFLVYAASFREQPHILYAVICLFVANFVGTLVHETGHALAALLCGWRVLVFAVRPVGLQLPNRDVVIVGRSVDQEYGGWVSSIPRTLTVGTGTRYSIIVLAGPIASLALAIVAFVATGTVFADVEYGHFVRLDGLAFGLGVQSLGQAVWSFLPSWDGKIVTDGTKWRALRKRDDTYHIYGPLVWLARLADANVRLRDRPSWILDAAASASYPTETIALDVRRHLATGEIGRVLDSVVVDAPLARRLIENFRATYGNNDWLATCDAWLAAVWENDVERARAALARQTDLTSIPQMTLAAEAAIAARTGDAPTAKLRLDAMDGVIRQRSPFRDETFRDIRRYVEALLA